MFLYFGFSESVFFMISIQTFWFGASVVALRMANSPSYPVSEPSNSTCDSPTLCGSTVSTETLRYCSLPVRSESTVTTLMPLSSARCRIGPSASGEFGEMAMTDTPRWIWSWMKGIWLVASAVSGATLANSQPFSSAALLKPAISGSK